RGPVARPRPVGVDNPAHRTPEEARRAMSALQAGTARGRRDGARRAAEPSPPEPPAAPDQPTATERDA
ncbi:hypothetical protein ACWEH1_31020, partial [Micromonospora chersina]